MISNFRGELILRSVPGTLRLELAQKFAWAGQVDGVTREIAVPAGFMFDGASIPRVACPLIGGPWGEYREAACIHDWLYRCPFGLYPWLTRASADKVFYQALLTIPRMSRWKARVMYMAVRLGGRRSWRGKGG